MKNCCTTLEVKNPGNGDLDQHKKLYGTYTKSGEANGRAVYKSEDGKWGVWWCGQYWGFNKISKQGKPRKLFNMFGPATFVPIELVPVMTMYCSSLLDTLVLTE